MIRKVLHSDHFTAIFVTLQHWANWCGESISSDGVFSTSGRCRQAPFVCAGQHRATVSAGSRCVGRGRQVVAAGLGTDRYRTVNRGGPVLGFSVLGAISIFLSCVPVTSLATMWRRLLNRAGPAPRHFRCGPGGGGVQTPLSYSAARRLTTKRKESFRSSLKSFRNHFSIFFLLWSILMSPEATKGQI